jgi:LmbE family N-acetylglucosaminyl deacetylase
MPLTPRRVTKQRVLVVAPHPDDEVIAIGGILALHKQLGSEVLTLFATMDAPEADGTLTRKREAETAGLLLGYQCSFLGLPDGAVSLHEKALTAGIAGAIREHRPDSIYCPFPGDHHRDHMATAACTSAAVEQVGYSGEVCCYEVWTTLWPNQSVDISSVVEVKREAINCYVSQVAYTPYADGAVGLNRFRGLKLGVGYAESLFACSPSEFAKLSRGLGVV